MRFRILWLALCLWPAVARAEWLEASSAHFVIYADASESNARRFSEQLERYHAAMALLIGAKDSAPPSPSNRVTVYVVRNESAVRALYGKEEKDSRFIAGFYRPGAGRSLAVVPEITAANGQSSFSMIILLHEYAHHFMISSNSWPMPRWMSEGGAEFFASTRFDGKGGIMLGGPAMHRAGELFMAADVKAADLLDPTEYDKRPKRSQDAFYGKSWLLYHYLTFEKTRSGQLQRYVDLLTTGKTMREAGLEAFGDFQVLERELDRYLTRTRMSVLSLKPEMLKIEPTTLRRLRPGEAAIMPVRVRSSVGVRTEEAAAAILVQARAIAARFPADAAVLSALAEAEYDAGNNKEATAAADAALAIDPGQVNAYVQKGYALFRVAADAPDRAVAYRAARKPFLDLNALENDHPIPLMYFYSSYVRQGAEPTDNALSGLIRAMQVAPFDIGLRLNLATALIKVGRQREAKIVLRPVAYDPHRHGAAETAQKMLTRLESEPGWRGAGMDSMMAGSEDDEGGEE